MAEMKADTICTLFKKLTSEERNQLAIAGKCFYCKKPGHIVRGCPSHPKQRYVCVCDCILMFSDSAPYV